MENREYHVESESNAGEAEIINNLKKAKETFKELVKRVQETIERINGNASK